MLSTIGRAAVRRLVSKPIATSSVVSRLSLRAGQSQNSLGWLVSSFEKSCAIRSFAAAADGVKTTTRKRAAAKTGTASKKAAAKPKKEKVVKKPTRAAAEKKKTRAGRPKRQLTQEEQDKLQIKELKKTALFSEEPKNVAAVVPWRLFIQEKLSGSKVESSSQFPQMAADYKSLSSSELARLKSDCEKNKLQCAANHKAWVESHTPAKIREANNARKLLKRKFDYPKARKHLIKDDRFTRPTTSFAYFTKARWASGDFSNMGAAQAAKILGAEWSALSDSEKKPYVELGEGDSHRAQKEAEKASP